MIHQDVSVERFTFTCVGCGHVWSVDHGVQHVEDGHGHERDYFLRNGLPGVNPTGQHAVVCPRCGRDQIHARATAHPAAATVARPAGSGDRREPGRTAESSPMPGEPAPPRPADPGGRSGLAQ